MITQTSYAGLIMMIAFGLILPIGTAVWWIRKKKEKVRTVVIGALTWLLFAVLLESIPKLFLLNQATPIGRAVLGNTALAAAVGSLLAGIFEETGRLLAFKTVLRNRDNKETSISHGIGHGGFEALYILVMTGVQYLVYASMINAGRFSELIEAAAAQGADVSALESLPSVDMSYGIREDLRHAAACRTLDSCLLCGKDVQNRSVFPRGAAPCAFRRARGFVSAGCDQERFHRRSHAGRIFGGVLHHNKEETL